MVEVEHFISRYRANPFEARDWLQKNPTLLSFNELQNFLDLIQFFQELENKGENYRPLLSQVTLDNAEKIVALFNNLKQFDKHTGVDAHLVAYMVRSILIKKAGSLVKSPYQFYELIKNETEWFWAFYNNQEELFKISLLFTSWDSILACSKKLDRAQGLFESNPKHFAKLFSDPEQINAIYSKNLFTARKLVQALGNELADLYSTPEQLSTLAIIDPNVAESIGREKNISLNTPDNLPRAPLANNELHQDNQVTYTPSENGITMIVLGGFIAAVGIAAVAVAFAVLSMGIAGLITAGVGVVATLVGIGIFSAGISIKAQTVPIPDDNLLPSPN